MKATARSYSYAQPEWPSTATQPQRTRLRAAFDAPDPFWLELFDSTVARLTKRELVSRVLLASEFLQHRYSTDDLQQWRGRILILDADEDPLMPPRVRSALRSLYPTAEVHTFSGTGHSAAILRPEEYAQAIASFLSRNLTSVNGAF